MDPQAYREFYPYTTTAISTLSFDPETQTHIPFRARTKHTHTTWARTHFSSPELYLQPASIPELRLIVDLARTLHKPLTLTGSSHSPSTLTQTSSWLINLDNFSRVVSASDHRITVEAGIRLHQLLKELDSLGWTMPNLGSITEQSIAGAIATSTHGSSLRHGLLSESIEELTIMLSSGKLVRCSMEKNVDLFRAALVSLGALGIITHVTFRAVPAFDVAWSQRVVSWPGFIENFENSEWTKHEFARCWWFPYSQKAVVWSGDKTEEPRSPPPKSWYGGGIARWSYEALLYVATFFPRLVPVVERFVFRMQYGMREGLIAKAVEKSDEALTMDCLFSQLVNEVSFSHIVMCSGDDFTDLFKWSIPLHHGPEALTRLTAWLNHDLETARIPVSPASVYVHAPIEVRVSDTSSSPQRPFLDQSITTGGPTLYLNATLYRPFCKTIPHWERYYEAFEYLMKEYGGKPHWAKNWVTVSRDEMWGMYGEDMEKWVAVRKKADPEGVFVNDWLREHVLGKGRELEEKAQVEVAEIEIDE